MQFTVQREIFLKPLKAVAGVVERRVANMLPILLNVLIRVTESSFSLTTTDQEIELIAEGPIESSEVTGETTIPFRKLMDICRALPEAARLSFVHEQDKLVIRALRSRFTLSTLPSDEFPNLTPNLESLRFSVSKKSLRSLIENTYFSMAEQDVRYYLNGMLFEINKEGIFVVAADGHRLALGSYKGISPPENTETRVIVPRKGILELQRVLYEGNDEVVMMIGPNHIRVVTDTVTLTSKLLDAKFPPYDRIIPKGGDKVVVGQREMLKEAFHRAAALFTDKFRGVRLRLSAGCLKILATNTEHDEVEEDVGIDYQGSELEIGFNVKYLIDCLNVLQTDCVRFTFSDSNSSALVEGVGGDGGIYVIMPMKI